MLKNGCYEMAALTCDLYWKICIHTTEFENMGYSPDKIKESIKQAVNMLNNRGYLVWCSGAYEITGPNSLNSHELELLLGMIELYIVY